MVGGEQGTRWVGGEAPSNELGSALLSSNALISWSCAADAARTSFVELKWPSVPWWSCTACCIALGYDRMIGERLIDVLVKRRKYIG